MAEVAATAMPPANIRRTERDKTVSTIIVAFPVSTAVQQGRRRLLLITLGLNSSKAFSFAARQSKHLRKCKSTGSLLVIHKYNSKTNYYEFIFTR
jgi:hypothetical protein